MGGLLSRNEPFFQRRRRRRAAEFVAHDGMVGRKSVLKVRNRLQIPEILASSSHRSHETDRWIAEFGPCEMQAVGLSVKFCAIAERSADIYPRFGPTMEWDTTAGDAILRAARSMTRTLDGAPLRNGKSPAFAKMDFIAAN